MTSDLLKQLVPLLLTPFSIPLMSLQLAKELTNPSLLQLFLSLWK